MRTLSPGGESGGLITLAELVCLRHGINTLKSVSGLLGALCILFLNLWVLALMHVIRSLAGIRMG